MKNLEHKKYNPKVDEIAGDFDMEGWITRAGKFIPCDREFGHGLAASLALGGDEDTAELRAEKLKWIRLSTSGDRVRGEPNQAQLNTLFDWCQTMKCDYREILENMQKL